MTFEKMINATNDYLRMVWQLSIKTNACSKSVSSRLSLNVGPSQDWQKPILDKLPQQITLHAYMRDNYDDFEAKGTRVKCYPNEELPSSPRFKIMEQVLRTAEAFGSVLGLHFLLDKKLIVAGP